MMLEDYGYNRFELIFKQNTIFENLSMSRLIPISEVDNVIIVLKEWERSNSVSDCLGSRLRVFFNFQSL